MPFLNPFLLWGLTFTAVPVLLMLFMNRRKLVIHWAAYEWMRNAIIQRKKKIEIDQILKLISKILLITAVVVMIARPFIRLKGGRGNALIVMDNSPSMGVTYQAGTRLDRARKLLDRFVTSHDNKMAIYAFDGRFEPVVAKFTGDKKTLSDGLKTVSLGGAYAGATTFFEQLGALSILKDTKKVYFVGDFQTHWYGDGAKIAEEVRRLRGAYPMVWQQVDARPEIQNCAVERIDLSPDGMFPGRECVFNVRVLNGSNRPMTDRVLTLFVDGNRKSRVTLNLEPNERREISCAIMLEEDGWHNVSAEMDSDPFDVDNVQYAAVRVPRAMRVLAVVPSQGTAPFPYDTYVGAAMRGLIPAEKLDYRTISPLQLPGANLSDVDILLTVNIPLSRDAPYAATIREFVERGGGIVGFLTAADAGEASLFGVEAAVSQKPGAVTRKHLKGTYLSFMEAPNLKPENIFFLKALVFLKAQPKDARLVADGGVIAVSVKQGKGRVALLGFLPYQGYTNLHFNPNFVQMMLRVLWETYNRRAIYSIAGKFDELPIPWLNRDCAYALHDEHNNRWPLAVDGLAENTRLLVPSGLAFGFYSLREDDGEKIRLGYSADTGDSMMEPVSEEEIKEPIKEGLVFSTSDKIPVSATRIDLLVPAMILLALAVAFEAYAHFFRGNGGET